MIPRLLAFAAVAALMACSPSAPSGEAQTGAAAAPIVGVLEDRPGATTEEAQRFIVRAAFHKDDGGWRAYDLNCGDEACLKAATARIPGEVTWTIALHGQRLGEVVARTPAAWTLYADAGRMDLAEGAVAPTSGARAADFSDGAESGVFRPLVATSTGAFADPVAWAAATPSAETALALRAAFRAKFTDVTNCASETAAAKPRTYTDGDIDVSATQASATRWNIATLKLTDYRCDGPVDDTAYADQTYAVSPTNEVKFLGEGLRYLDAGDYDTDGATEVVFAILRSNEGGYTLFANDFADRADFMYAHH